MISIQQRVSSFSSLGQVFEVAASGAENSLGILAESVKSHNGWFTPENVRFAYKQWSELLKKNLLNDWLKPYGFSETNPRTVGIIMAGNIPLVGLHDLMCVVLSGNKALVKCSSKDTVLMTEIIEILLKIEPQLESCIQIEQATLKNFDAIIATGSDNSSRYFDYYFGKYPHIIRKNRTSVAIIEGKETLEELNLLGWDIFRYFGLGCRSVTKLYVPENYDFTSFFEAISNFKFVLEHTKYSNNYEYNKAIFLLNKTVHLDNGFLLLTEDTKLFTPAGLLHFETYQNQLDLEEKLKKQSVFIQCRLANKINIEASIPFGSSQTPGLNHFADGVNTLEFLKSLPQ